MSASKRTWCGLWCVGLIVFGGAGCAALGGKKTSADPGARQVQVSQEQSQRAIEQARDAQKKASDQAKRAAEAQEEVRELQQRLAQAQEKSKAEQEKARQAQLEANQATERATAEARRSQQQASRALAQQSEKLQRGEQTLSGEVLRATDEALEVRPKDGGDAMSFRVTPETRVEIGGRAASASELRQGEDARVSYEVTGEAQPTATSVQVLRALSTEKPSREPPAVEQPSSEQRPTEERPR